MTFDLEEFDLPLEYNCHIEEQDQFCVTNEGLQRLMPLLDKYQIRTTFFTTSHYCEHNSRLVKTIAAGHEIASHAHFHSKFSKSDLAKSKNILEHTIQKKIFGFRMPQMGEVDYQHLYETGYSYDSSINPTMIPGRYNNFCKSRRPYITKTAKIIEIPVSVTPVIRIPLFWLSFKNLPLAAYLFLCKCTLQYDTVLHLYFHPWEFADLGKYKIPGFIKMPSGTIYVKKFNQFLKYLNAMAEFISISDFIKQKYI